MDRRTNLKEYTMNVIILSIVEVFMELNMSWAKLEQRGLFSDYPLENQNHFLQGFPFEWVNGEADYSLCYLAERHKHKLWEESA